MTQGRGLCVRFEFPLEFNQMPGSKAGLDFPQVNSVLG